MKTSRQQVLEFVQLHRVVTAADISQAFQMTSANSRHHLNILRKQGLIEISGHLPTNGKGRPANLYSISHTSLGNNLTLLLDVLLFDLQNTRTNEEYDKFLQRLMINYIERIYSIVDNSSLKPNRYKNLTQRLNKSIQFLNKYNYYARWEAHSDGPRIILDHCPYLAILDNNPEICRFDKYFLDELLDAEVVQISKLVKDYRGVPHCVFQIIGTTIF